jgi:hypothetical protein
MNTNFFGEKPMKDYKLLFWCVFFYVLFSIFFKAKAQEGVTVESVAESIAMQHNAANYHDEMTVSNTAKAVGKNIIFTSVLRVKKGLPPQKLEEFKNASYLEMVPQMCKVNEQNIAFNKMGLFYTVVSFNTYDEKLFEFVVNKSICDGLSHN